MKRKSVTICLIVGAMILFVGPGYSKNLKEPEDYKFMKTPLVIKEAVFSFTDSNFAEIRSWVSKNVKVEGRRYKTPVDSNESVKDVNMPVDKPYFAPQHMEREDLGIQGSKYSYELTVCLPEDCNLPEFIEKIIDEISGKVTADDLSNGKSIFDLFEWLPRDTFFLETINIQTGDVGDRRPIDILLKEISEDRRKFILRTEYFQPTPNPIFAGRFNGWLKCFVPADWPDEFSELRVKSSLFELPNKFNRTIKEKLKLLVDVERGTK
ncbi:MAG: hypothetical protein PHH54_06320 [Candidatus Nanoarchaeia archaeon]|nr:hypothetical protein [Candidatus Nanoarchaeia archaeon]